MSLSNHASLAIDNNAPNPIVRRNHPWPDGLTARPCVDTDADALWELFGQDDFRRYAMMDAAQFETPDAVRHWLASNKPAAFHIVGFIGGTLVAFGGLYPLSGRQDHVGWLTLTIHEAFRGRGVGSYMLRMLLATAETWAGLRRVQLHVLADNAVAVSLYETVGFRMEGRHEALVRSETGYVDVQTMALHLGPQTRA